MRPTPSLLECTYVACSSDLKNPQDHYPFEPGAIIYYLNMQTLTNSTNRLFAFFFFSFFFLLSKPSNAQWTGASVGLPTSGIGTTGYTALAESGNTLYIGSLDGELYYNDFSTGLSKSWTHITKPSGAVSPITNICANGSYLYVNWNTEIYLSSNNGASWTKVATNFEASPSSTYYLGFNNQMFASDGIYFWYLKQSTGTIYQSTIGNTSGTWTTYNTISSVGTINCFYQYQNRLFVGTTTGLYATRATGASGGWSDEFAGTPYSGTAVYQFINTQYSTTYPDPVSNQNGYVTGHVGACSLPSPSSYTYYPFYMITNSCGTTAGTACPKIIQQVETRSVYVISSGPGSMFFCPGGTQYNYRWQSAFSYTDNSRSFGFPSSSAHDNFVTASGDVTAGLASAAKIWGITTASSGSELGTYVNTATWTTGTGGITGLPSFTNLNLNAALGSHNTYGSLSGLVFLSCRYSGGYGMIYAMSYTQAKTGEDDGPIFTLNAKDASSSLNLFPNPTSNKITFDISTLASTDFELRIYNQLGQEVLIPASNSSLDAGEMKLSVNVATLPTGIYFYKLKADKDYSGKFVKE